MAIKKPDPATDAVARYTIDALRLASQHLLHPLNVLRELSSTLIDWIKRTSQTVNRVFRLRDLINGAKLAIADSYKLIVTRHVAELRDFAKVAVEGARAVIAAAAGLDVFQVPMNGRDAVTIANGKIIFGRSVSESWNDHARDLVIKFTAAMNQGVFLNEKTAQLSARVEGTEEAAFKDGLIPRKMREAETMTETAALTVANAVRNQAFAEMSDVVEILTWSAILDSKTCRICSALHGKSWTAKDLKPIGHSFQFPGVLAHHRCRCGQTPGLKEWGAIKAGPSTGGEPIKARVRAELLDAGMDHDAIPAAIDAIKARIGKRSAPSTFDEWLASKSHADVNKILGPGRAKLWEKGMALDQMVSQSLRPFTIKELEAKWTGERLRSNRDFVGMMAALSAKKKK